MNNRIAFLTILILSIVFSCTEASKNEKGKKQPKDAKKEQLNFEGDEHDLSQRMIFYIKKRIDITKEQEEEIRKIGLEYDSIDYNREEFFKAQKEMRRKVFELVLTTEQKDGVNAKRKKKSKR